MCVVYFLPISVRCRYLGKKKNRVFIFNSLKSFITASCNKLPWGEIQSKISWKRISEAQNLPIYQISANELLLINRRQNPSL